MFLLGDHEASPAVIGTFAGSYVDEDLTKRWCKLPKRWCKLPWRLAALVGETLITHADAHPLLGQATAELTLEALQAGTVNMGSVAKAGRLRGGQSDWGGILCGTSGNGWPGPPGVRAHRQREVPA